MLFDHVTYLWPVSLAVWEVFFPDAPQLPQAAAVAVQASDYLGRIAAPIFLYAITCGYRHTRSVKRYALRLLVFACLAEYPYYLLFGMHGNTMFTLLAGLLTLTLFDWGNRLCPGLGWSLSAAVIAAAELLAIFEGRGRYLLFILVFYLTQDWPAWKKSVVWLVLLPLARYSLTWSILFGDLSGVMDGRRLVHLWLVNTMGPFLGVALTFCHNGQKGRGFPGDKYLWYLFYPAHLLVLGLLAHTGIL